MLEKLAQDITKPKGVTEELKASDQMAWVGAMKYQGLYRVNCVK